MTIGSTVNKLYGVNQWGAGYFDGKIRIAVARVKEKARFLDRHDLREDGNALRAWAKKAASAADGTRNGLWVDDKHGPYHDFYSAHGPANHAMDQYAPRHMSYGGKGSNLWAARAIRNAAADPMFRDAMKKYAQLQKWSKQYNEGLYRTTEQHPSRMLGSFDI